MPDGDQSLGAMTTLWTVVLRAGGEQSGTAARQELCRRYHGAVERFLRAIVPDPAAAAELAQDFAVKLLKGDLAGASPDRGRFRDFVKGVLRHQLVDRYRRRTRELQPGDDVPEPASPDDDIAALDREWAHGWRQELLNRTWAALEEHQVRTGQPVAVVLRLRSHHPEARSHEMAEQLAPKLGRPVSAEWVRQTLHRARERFGQLLVDEVADTLSNPGVGDLEDELAELELLQYCKPALEKWRRDDPGGVATSES